jgi:hypothetical protein
MPSKAHNSDPTESHGNSEIRKSSISSTRREMRGLMRAIDTASNSDLNYRERREGIPQRSESPPDRVVPKKSTIRSESQPLSSPSMKKAESGETLSRRAPKQEEASHHTHSEPQSRQASAENSFIQRVRRSYRLLCYSLTLNRSLSFKQSQVPKSNPKQP